MKKKRHFLILVLTAFVGFGCISPPGKKIVRKQIGNYYIEAPYINDTIEGMARYYDTNNRLISIVEYKNDLKYGPAINFYESGMKRDSSFYRDGLRNGKSFVYDSLGNKIEMSSYYYGILVGDNISYSNGKPREYFFNDFHGNTHFSIRYDTAGRCKIGKMGKSSLLPITYIFENESGMPKMNVFFYFPQPPNLTTTFSIGLMDEKMIKVKETLININNRFFIDTILSQPQKGYQYYISMHIQNIKDSINQVIINKLAW